MLYTLLKTSLCTSLCISDKKSIGDDVLPYNRLYDPTSDLNRVYELAAYYNSPAGGSCRCKCE